MELRHNSIAEDTEDADLESSRGILYPPADSGDADPAVSGGQIQPLAGDTRPVPKPRRKASARTSRPESPLPSSPCPVIPASPASPSLPSPCPATPTPSPRYAQPPESGATVVRGPLPPPPAPPPPPLAISPVKNSKKTRTKAFHWDLVGPEKVSYENSDPSSPVPINCVMKQVVLFFFLLPARLRNHFGYKKPAGGLGSTRRVYWSSFLSKMWGRAAHLRPVTPSTSCSTRRSHTTLVSASMRLISTGLCCN